MDKKNVLYILGAGASAGAIPILAKWIDELGIFSASLKLMIEGLEQNPKIPVSDKDKYGKKLQTVLDDCNWLIENSKSQYTIDTFAKKLFIKKDEANLARLKKIVSTFLVFYQTQETLLVQPTVDLNGRIPHQVRDQRYETLLSYLLGKGDTQIPNNVKFISWNYDAQIELALAQFVGSWQSIVETVTNNSDQLYKINGTVATIDIKESNLKKIDMPFHWMFHREYEPEDLVILCYETIGFGSGISYAWEKPDLSQITERLKLMKLESVSEVVIVGYSFPFFNSSVDREILTAIIPSMPNVYLQYPENEHSKVLEKIRALGILGFRETENAGRFNMISDIDTFYVPYGT